MNPDSVNPEIPDYYLFPIKPGVRNTLAGTMGELRRTHFHTGIDIRTGGVQGVPVLAAADGYVSRLSISPGGYGNAIYISHNNGQMTVYAHLLSFNQLFESYVVKEQYKKESFRVNLFPEKGEFKVNKGDTIALSGNSGSSGGPHLHFDVRNSEQEVLNPLIFNFEEIVDTRPPEVRKIAFKTMDINSRINGKFGRFVYNAKKVNGTYVIDNPIDMSGTIGVELYAFDRQDWTKFRTGITRIEMKFDDKVEFVQEISKIPFSKSRNYYNHVNYSELKQRGLRYHKLYVDDGNELDFYTTSSNHGLITFNEDCSGKLDIIMNDSYGNQSELIVDINCLNDSLESHYETPTIDGSSHEIQDNTLVVYSVITNGQENAEVHIGHDTQYLLPAYNNEGIDVFLWDLNEGIPDSITLCESTEYIRCDAQVPSGQVYTFYSPYIEAQFSKRTLFDTIYLDVSHRSEGDKLGERFIVGADIYPIRTNVNILLIPQNNYTYKERSSVYAVDDAGNFYYSGGKWEGDKIRFKTRSFGQFVILTDTIPPRLKPLIINKNELVFRIEDKLSGIKSYKATINDNWVLMNYDPKKKQIWSKKINSDLPFKGKLTLTVTDNSGNEKVYSTTVN